MAHRIFAGLSGGVDSAVSAALLKRQGLDVTGVFIKIWQPEFIECTWAADRLDAMRVCAALDIPFREIDFSQEYKTQVVERMVREYAKGVTPNPDVLCNRHIKFGSFLEWAKSEGASAVATGHYAQKREVVAHHELLRAFDTSKDQSYFLFRLGQTELARVVFPIGNMLKSEVRALAKKFALPVAAKPDSQGLCFVGEVSMQTFLRRFIPVEEGNVVCDGEIVGKHEGAALYTVGQRHGFTFSPHEGSAHPPEVPAHYVKRVDVASNTIHVSPYRPDAASAGVMLEDVHWIYREPTFPYTVNAQARYHEQPVKVTLTKGAQGVRVAFAEPHIASAGQSLVFYELDASGKKETSVCLGGGTISA